MKLFSIISAFAFASDVIVDRVANLENKLNELKGLITELESIVIPVNDNCNK